MFGRYPIAYQLQMTANADHNAPGHILQEWIADIGKMNDSNGLVHQLEVPVRFANNTRPLPTMKSLAVEISAIHQAR